MNQALQSPVEIVGSHIVSSALPSVVDAPVLFVEGTLKRFGEC